MDDPHADMEIKTQLRPRGSVGKEEDPKPSHHCTSCRSNPHDHLGRLWLWNTEKTTKRSHRRKCTTLIAVDIGGKSTQE